MAAAAKNPQLVINDPKRVEVIYDRGERQYRHDHPELTRRRDIAPSPSDPNIVQQIALDLQLALVTGYGPGCRQYVPRRRFDEIVTPEVVLQLISQLPCFGAESTAGTLPELAADIYFGKGDRGPCRKLLCVLIEIERGDDLKELMEQDMTDDCLPLMTMRHNGPNQHQLSCRHHKSNHKVINEYKMPDWRDRFSQWSQRLMPLYITWRRDTMGVMHGEGPKHRHYILEATEAMPMTMNKTTGRAEGGFSDVVAVEIEASSRWLADIGFRNAGDVFALKTLKKHPNDDPEKQKIGFDMEVRTWVFADYHSKKPEYNREPGSILHMIPLLASFEVQDPQEGGSEYHLLFDWAEGNLQQFWESHDDMVRNLDCLKWTAEQFFKLANALQLVHNASDKMPSSLANTFSTLYGRHGDIKPSNFLYFKLPDGNKILVMSDFGLGRLHTKISRSNADPKNTPMTISYRAPEFDVKGGKVSPRSDVWSMGCVFLEHITWYLRGKASVVDFASKRMEVDKKYKFELDTFFELSEDETTATTKGKVKEWIEELKRDEACCEYLFKMLDLIEKEMLNPDWVKRISAKDLVNKLEKMLKCAEHSESFYTKHGEESKWCSHSYCLVLY